MSPTVKSTAVARYNFDHNSPTDRTRESLTTS